MPPGKVAIHEAGHAIVGFLKKWKIEKVTIVPDTGKDSLGECKFAQASSSNLKDTCMIYLGGLAAQRVAGCEDENYQSQDDYKTTTEQVKQKYEPNGAGQYVEQDVSAWLSEATTLLQNRKGLLLELAARLEAEPDKTLTGNDAEKFIALHINTS